MPLQDVDALPGSRVVYLAKRDRRWALEGLERPEGDPYERLSDLMCSEEAIAYVALLTVGKNGKKDALGVVDTDPASPDYGTMVRKLEFPNGGNELHHFGWNACSACLCPQAPHAHMERRYLIVPGIGSSRIHILDTKPDPKQPKLVKVIEALTMESSGRITNFSTGQTDPF